jgi:hypothetical protein
LIIALLTAALLIPSLRAEEEQPELLRAAIFVQNRAGEKFRDKADVLNDLLTTRLTEKGFSIINKQDVIERFRVSRDPALQKAAEALEKGSIEDALKDASATRLAQMMQADYIIIATITSYGHRRSKFSGRGTGYGVDNEATSYTLRVGCKVLEGSQGGSIYGDVVKVSENQPGLENLKTDYTEETLNSLLDRAAVKIAQNVGEKIDYIRTVRVKHLPAVPFSVSSNVLEGATLQLDGAVIGSIGVKPRQFLVAPGIHMMKVSRQWFQPWEKPVNVVAGQEINVTLKLSEEGTARYKDIEAFNQQMEAERAKVEIAREQSEASAYSKKLIAEGEKKKREESYTRVDTSKVENLSVGDKTPHVIVEHEEVK